MLQERVDLEDYCPENENYFTSRMMTKIAKFYGERGELAVGTYAYFRWVDDSVDLSPSSKKEKLHFLDRQKSLIEGDYPENPHPMETAFTDLPWNVVEDHKEKLTNLSLALIETIKDDVIHSDSNPRTYEELKEYNIKTFLTSMEALSIIFNGKDFEPDNEFKEFLNHWYVIGSLRDFQEDIERHSLHVGFTQEEAEQLLDLPTAEERRMEALYIYDEQRFMDEKQQNLNELRQRKSEFLKLNMPFWQKALCFSYMHRACLKAQFTVQYPSQEITSKLKREGLKVKTKRLIEQNRQI